MPIVNTSDGFYAVIGNRSQGPFPTREAAALGEIQLAKDFQGPGMPPPGAPSPQFPTVRLGPQGTPMKVTPAVMPQPQVSIGDAVVEPEGTFGAGPLTITIGDAVLEKARARQAPATGRRMHTALPKKSGKRP
jgi:hypothetical protein